MVASRLITWMLYSSQPGEMVRGKMKVTALNLETCLTG